MHIRLLSLELKNLRERKREANEHSNKATIYYVQYIISDSNLPEG